ncbi:MAG: UDP-4-amino-4,6-dideoxy-N-acetyl-beta-L-altrosamine transaminase [Bacteroidia bacterium]|nr:UDP-4-amino-4,6-dideoxy-N-acetyl-beta-L-altrosamine transaminase [Bacteroidia bacterium]
MNPIPYGRQHITPEDIQAVTETLLSDYLTTGPKVAEFEEAFCQYIGCKYAVALANGTAALHLAALALGVKPGQKVITTPITFAASANCVRYCGGEVEFVDIDPDTFLIDLKKVRKLLESHPKGTYSGLIPVDLAGYPVNLEEARELADEFGLWILEDACHAPGGFFKDSKGVEARCGDSRYADAAIFSFHPVKHIASGEGGMITTNNEALYKELLVLRTHGITRDESIYHQENHGGWYHEMQILGYNYRLTDFQCALGLSQLKRADEGMIRRHEIARTYDQAFANTLVTRPFVEEGIGHAYHLYVIQVEDRKGLYDHLRANQIYAQVHYIPCHTHPYYQSLGWKWGDFPLAENYYHHCLSLPMYPSLTAEEQAFVIEKVLEFTEK